LGCAELGAAPMQTNAQRRPPNHKSFLRFCTTLWVPIQPQTTLGARFRTPANSTQPTQTLLTLTQLILIPRHQLSAAGHQAPTAATHLPRRRVRADQTPRSTLATVPLHDSNPPRPTSRPGSSESTESSRQRAVRCRCRLTAAHRKSPGGFVAGRTLPSPVITSRNLSESPLSAHITSNGRLRVKRGREITSNCRLRV
jgi:hypothetical protein